MTSAERNLQILTNAIKTGLENKTAEVKWAPMERGIQMVHVDFIDTTRVTLSYKVFNDIALTAKYKKRVLGNNVII